MGATQEQGGAQGQLVPCPGTVGLMNGFQFYCLGDILKGFKEKSMLVTFVF